MLTSAAGFPDVSVLHAGGPVVVGTARLDEFCHVAASCVQSMRHGCPLPAALSTPQAHR